MSDPSTRSCETCGAFYRVRTDPRLGTVGECALEVYPPPIAARSICSRYRAKGAAAPPPPPRAAGEPRRRGGGDPTPSASTQPPRAVAPPPPLPQEIDIDMDIEEFRSVLRQVIAEELGVSQPPLGPRWQGGEMVLRPGKPGTQEKIVPIDTFFRKIVTVRDKLRLLEAKVNGHPGLSDEDKVQLEAYITGCYGALTTFNLLFADKDDQIRGQGRDD